MSRFIAIIALAIGALGCTPPALAANLVLSPDAEYNVYACPRGTVVGGPNDVIDARPVSYDKGAYSQVNIVLDQMVSFGQCNIAIRGFRRVETSPNGGSVIGTDDADVIHGNATDMLAADYADGRGGNDELTAVSASSALFGGAGLDKFTTAYRTTLVPAHWPINRATGRFYSSTQAKRLHLAKIPAKSVTVDAVRDAAAGEIVVRR